jgi:hypothetical protein
MRWLTGQPAHNRARWLFFASQFLLAALLRGERPKPGATQFFTEDAAGALYSRGGFLAPVPPARLLVLNNALIRGQLLTWTFDDILYLPYPVAELHTYSTQAGSSLPSLLFTDIEEGYLVPLTAGLAVIPFGDTSPRSWVGSQYRMSCTLLPSYAPGLVAVIPAHCFLCAILVCSCLLT